MDNLDSGIPFFLFLGVSTWHPYVPVFSLCYLYQEHILPLTKACLTHSFIDSIARDSSESWA